MFIRSISRKAESDSTELEPTKRQVAASGIRGTATKTAKYHTRASLDLIRTDILNSHVKRHGRQKGHWKLNKEENEQIILRFQKKS